MITGSTSEATAGADPRRHPFRRRRAGKYRQIMVDLDPAKLLAKVLTPPM